MKPFTSKHCTPMFYGSPLNQKDDNKKKEKKDDTFKYLKGFVSSAERSKKNNTKTSTEDFYKRKRELEAKNSAPTNYNKDKKKEKQLTRAEINKKYQGKLDTKKGPKGPGHSGRFNELIGKKVTSGDKGNSPLDIRRSMEAKRVMAKQKANTERARKAGNLGRKTTRCASGKPCKGGTPANHGSHRITVNGHKHK